MSFQDSLRQLANTVRGVAADYGVRNYTVVIRTETYGDSAGMGAPTVSDLTLTPSPRVREVTPWELLVGPITPSHTGGGYTPAQLNPSAAATSSQRVTYRVTGDNGTREYLIKDLTTDRGYHYMLRLIAIEYDGPH